MTCIRFAKGVWKCRAMVNCKYVIIGEFKTKIDAIQAYNNFIVKNNINRKLININT